MSINSSKPMATVVYIPSCKNSVTPFTTISYQVSFTKSLINKQVKSIKFKLITKIRIIPIW